MREERTGRAIANGLIFLPIFFAVAYLLLGYSGARWMFFYGLWCILAAHAPPHSACAPAECARGRWGKRRGLGR